MSVSNYTFINEGFANTEWLIANLKSGITIGLKPGVANTHRAALEYRLKGHDTHDGRWHGNYAVTRMQRPYWDDSVPETLVLNVAPVTAPTIEITAVKV